MKNNISFLRPTKTVLDNGLTVLYIETKNDPVSAAHLFFPVGASREPMDKSGLTTLMWTLFTKGTKRRTARQIAEDVESLGASIGAGASYDYSEISCHAIQEDFPKILEITAEALFEPAFDQVEIEKEKKALIAAIQSKKESIFTITHEKLNHHLYGQHPYGRPSSGTETSVSALTKSDVENWHASIVNPKGAILSIASSHSLNDILPLIRKLYGQSAAYGATSSTAKAVSMIIDPLQKNQSHINQSQFEQAYLMLGFPAAPIISDDYIHLKILNGILGGGMSARLFQNLREKEGLAYDVGAFYPTRQSASGLLIYIGLQMSRMEEAKKRIVRELETIQQEEISETELHQAVNYLKGTFILDHQTNSQRAHYVGWWLILGREPDFDNTYLTGLDQVTSSDLKKLARKIFSQPSITVETHPKKVKVNSGAV